MILGTPTNSSLTFGEVGIRRFATPPRTPITSWRKSPVSSIFKPRRHGAQQNHHPSHLCVPMLGSATTESFADSSWVNSDGHRYQQLYNTQHQHPQQLYPQQQYQQQLYSPSYPQPPPTRSPRTIRFIDEQLESSSSSTTLPLSHLRVDDAVEITPNSVHPFDRKHLSPPSNNYKGTVSRRGRRPALISRHSSH